MAASIKEEAAASHDGASQLLLSPRSLFSSTGDDVKSVVLEVQGKTLPVVLEPILIKYSGYFRRHLRNFPTGTTVSTIKTPWPFLEKDVLSTWLLLVHQQYYSGACDLTPKDSAEQCSSLESLVVLAKLHRLCELAESHIIQAWVSKTFKSTIDNCTPLWAGINDQDKSLDCLQRAWREWTDADCKTMIVTKINKTLPDKVYDRVADVMDHDFQKAVSKERLKVMSKRIAELEHQPKQWLTDTNTGTNTNAWTPTFGTRLANTNTNTPSSPFGTRLANTNTNTPSSLFGGRVANTNTDLKTNTPTSTFGNRLANTNTNTASSLFGTRLAKTNINATKSSEG
ncbi:hypothetical protein SCARD494_03388 [Seiridium cardinale]